MRGHDLLKRWQALSPEDRDYAVQYLCGALGMVAEGFTEPHRDKPHADWSLAEFEKALAATANRNPVA